MRHANGKDGLLTVILRPHYIFGIGSVASVAMLQPGGPLPLFGRHPYKTSASPRCCPLFARVLCVCMCVCVCVYVWLWLWLLAVACCR
ncbi:MAG: hypothetical protein P4L40_13655 [Terracidiphilus sp.]|nr:hypothetical protein [Terracidiphilus sp.]